MADVNMVDLSFTSTSTSTSSSTGKSSVESGARVSRQNVSWNELVVEGGAHMTRCVAVGLLCMTEYLYESSDKALAKRCVHQRENCHPNAQDNNIAMSFAVLTTAFVAFTVFWDVCALPLMQSRANGSGNQSSSPSYNPLDYFKLFMATLYQAGAIVTVGFQQSLRYDRQDALVDTYATNIPDYHAPEIGFPTFVFMMGLFLQVLATSGFGSVKTNRIRNAQVQGLQRRVYELDEEAKIGSARAQGQEESEGTDISL
jgi:hypothetical protein